MSDTTAAPAVRIPRVSHYEHNNEFLQAWRAYTAGEEVPEPTVKLSYDTLYDFFAEEVGNIREAILERLRADGVRTDGLVDRNLFYDRRGRDAITHYDSERRWEEAPQVSNLLEATYRHYLGLAPKLLRGRVEGLAVHLSPCYWHQGFTPSDFTYAVPRLCARVLPYRCRDRRSVYLPLVNTGRGVHADYNFPYGSTGFMSSRHQWAWRDSQEKEAQDIAGGPAQLAALRLAYITAYRHLSEAQRRKQYSEETIRTISQLEDLSGG